MSIISEINRIKDAKADIKSAIEERGISVEGTIDTYADNIRSIQSDVPNIIDIKKSIEKQARIELPYDTESYDDVILNLPNISINNYLNVKLPNLTSDDLSELPNLDSLYIGENEEVIYFTYDNTLNDYDAFFSFYVNILFNVDLGHIENGEFVVDVNIATRSAPNSPGVQRGLLSDYTNLNYPIIRITPHTDTTSHISTVTLSTSNVINSRAYIALNQPIVDVRLSLPYAKTIANTSTYTTKRWVGENLKKLNTLESTFQTRYSLQSVQFRNVDVSNVTNCNSAFADCSMLSNVNFEDLQLTSKCINMASIFSNCQTLNEVTFNGNCDFSKVTTFASMFYNCTRLIRINGISNFDTSSSTDFSSMFNGCRMLVQDDNVLDLSNFSINSKCTTIANMFTGLRKIERIKLPSDIDTSNVTTFAGLFSTCYHLKRIDNADKLNLSKVTTVSQMFYCCYCLMELDCSKWSSNTCKNFYQMFYDCFALKYLKFGNLDGTACANWSTSTISNSPSSMFYGCYSIEEVDMGECTNWLVNKSLNCMFYSCSKMSKVTLPNSFGGTDMGSIFFNCSSLTEIVNLEYIDTSNATSIASMFCGCSCLTSIDISNFVITNKCTTLANLFSYCYSLDEVIIPSTWDTSNVKTISTMIGYCHNLKRFVCNIDTSKVTNFSSLLRDCFNIEYVDMTGCVMNQVTTASYVIDGSYSNVRKLTYFRIGELPKLAQTFNAYLLSKDSLLNILNNLPTLTSTLSLTLGSNNLAKLTTDEISIATNKGWTVK